MMDSETKKLVLMRLETMAPNVKVNLGSRGELSKADLIEHVKNEDSLGMLYAKVQLEYLKSMKGY